ncbi:MAG: hypothetical protein Ct9H300mP14_12460 [Gammaproteobacteria bacterium]|nr:MAG: hypothetical protein Ct9H300mP14_12460 [Gammaproteobacteria bacterium]
MNSGESGHTVREVPVYEVLAADIKSLGIEAVFGLMSDDTAIFVTALDMVGITFHGARHENAAISMAEGYASATGFWGEQWLDEVLPQRMGYMPQCMLLGLGRAY